MTYEELIRESEREKRLALEISQAAKLYSGTPLEGILLEEAARRAIVANAFAVLAERRASSEHPMKGSL